MFPYQNLKTKTMKPLDTWKLFTQTAQLTLISQLCLALPLRQSSQASMSFSCLTCEFLLLLILHNFTVLDCSLTEIGDSSSSLTRSWFPKQHKDFSLFSPMKRSLTSWDVHLKNNSYPGQKLLYERVFKSFSFRLMYMVTSRYKSSLIC